ncbi:hypothetical protein LDENG_00052340 [Lucifuga dentata]|nr:hypothetical protein LDENG_00052340 [Lucifuga dentata]
MAIIKHHERYIGTSTRSLACQWNITQYYTRGTHACCHGCKADRTTDPSIKSSASLLLNHRDGF